MLATLPTEDAALDRVYDHLLGSEATWLARLAGEQPAVAVWPALDADRRAALAAVHREAWTRWAEALTEEPSLAERTVSYATTAGGPHVGIVGEILHHVVLHGMYHRGQIAQGVRQGGGTPLPTDFVFFVRTMGAP